MAVKLHTKKQHNKNNSMSCARRQRNSKEKLRQDVRINIIYHSHEIAHGDFFQQRT